MKYLACTLLLAIGAPAFAQQAPAQPAPTQSTPTEQTDTPAAPTSATALNPGGYAPADPALRGTPEPGSKIVFVPSASPSEAFPPPPARAHYPVCKRGQYNACVERR